MKKYVVFFLCLIVVIFFIFYNNKKNNNILFSDKQEYVIDVSEEIVQKKIDKEINEYILNKDFTFDNPKVVLDPYNNSPLSALVIFYTSNSTEIKLYVNEKFMTTFESSKSHVLPIYGLKENCENKVVIEDEFNNKNELYIKTKALDNSNFYEYKTTNISDEHLFINTPVGKYAIDNDGDVSWYMSINNLTMDLTKDKKLIFLDKNGILIETDFLGKIYKKYYTLVNYNSHKIEKLDNGNIIAIDNDQSIVMIDYNTGKTIYSLNLYDILKKVDNEIELDSYEFYINHFQYDDINNTLLISFRTINMVMNYDLNTNEIKWIFSNHPLLSSKFDKYKLKLVKGDYPVGQHTPYLDGKKLYIFNNQYNLEESIDGNVTESSSAAIYEINDMKIKQIYKYDDNYSSGWYGSFFEKDNIKNINSGCIISDDLGKYSKVMELDNKNNILTEFITNYDSITVYQSFRESFYNDITSNYNVNVDKKNVISDLELIKKNYGAYDLKLKRKTGEFVKNIINASTDKTMVSFSELGIAFSIFEDYEVLFVDDNFNHYNMNVLESNKYKFVDIWKFYYSIYFSKIRGKYAMYIKIDDKYYNSNLVFNIK